MLQFDAHNVFMTLHAIAVFYVIISPSLKKKPVFISRWRFCCGLANNNTLVCGM
jgi:hypothetical protein